MHQVHAGLALPVNPEKGKKKKKEKGDVSGSFFYYL